MAQVIQSRIRSDVIEGPRDYTGPTWRLYDPLLKPGPDTVPAALDLAGLPWRNGIVLRAPNWLGDTVMSLPAAYRMRQAAPPACGCFVVCPEPLAALWKSLPWVTDVVGLPTARVTGDAARRLRAWGAGVGIVMPNSFGAAWDLFGLGIPARIGRCGRWRKPLLTHTIPSLPRRTPRERHQLSEYLELACLFGPPSWSAAYPGPELGEVSETLTRLGLGNGSGARERWLILAPGAAYGPAKQWPAGTFRQVADRWQKHGGRVAAVGTAKEVQTCRDAIDGIDGSLNLAGKTSLVELMAVLRQAACVVVNDSGVMHLAAAVGAPGVALFGSTDPVATGPVGGTWVVLMEKLECSPCFLRQCRITGGDCLGLLQLSAAYVSEAVDFVVQKRELRA